MEGQTLTLQLPWPPSVNLYWRHYQGRTLLSRAGRDYREVARLIATESGGLEFTGEVSVAIDVWLPNRKRRDLDNLLKAPLDCLVHAGVLADDSLIKSLAIEVRGYRVPGLLDVTIQPWQIRSA
jgi:crossover junction endodeoxyribonuclease RusA